MTTAQAESTIPTGTWHSDPVHSHAGFSVTHVVCTFRGNFKEFAATLSAVDGTARLSGRSPVESVQVNEENLYGHLQSPEFFDAEQHPEILFESTGIEREDDQISIEGDLTIKGITKRVTARGELNGPAPGPNDSERVGLDLETKVDRHDFGLDWNMDLPGGGKALGDEVTLTIHLELIKEPR
jgi:polyisoprenoid-binding protein YceI